MWLGFWKPSPSLIFKDRMDILSSCLTWHLVAKWLSAFEVGPNIKLDILRAICAQLKIYILAAPRTSEFEQICTFAGISLIKNIKSNGDFFTEISCPCFLKAHLGNFWNAGSPRLWSHLSLGPLLSQFGQDCSQTKPNQINESAPTHHVISLGLAKVFPHLSHPSISSISVWPRISQIYLILLSHPSQFGQASFHCFEEEKKFSVVKLYQWSFVAQTYEHEFGEISFMGALLSFISKPKHFIILLILPWIFHGGHHEDKPRKPWTNQSRASIFSSNQPISVLGENTFWNLDKYILHIGQIHVCNHDNLVDACWLHFGQKHLLNFYWW